MKAYSSPTVTEIGSISELTRSVINKLDGSGDVIVIGGDEVPVQGSSVIS